MAILGRDLDQDLGSRTIDSIRRSRSERFRAHGGEGVDAVWPGEWNVAVEARETHSILQRLSTDDELDDGCDVCGQPFCDREAELSHELRRCVECELCMQTLLSSTAAP